jgi:hypothetical protein
VQLLYAIPHNDLGAFLQGVWKRTLVHRHFGGAFSLEESSNTIVAIERSVKDAGARRGEAVTLRWSFGTHLSTLENDLHFGFETKLVPDTVGTAIMFQYHGRQCTGHFYPSASLTTLQFVFEDGIAMVTYRAMDANTMAVCIVEAREKATPTVQLGHLFRLREEAYLLPPPRPEDVEEDEE